MKWHLFRGAEALRHPKAKSKSGEPLYTFQKAEALEGIGEVIRYGKFR
jgi:hypothetical protein